ncbi:MAG: hypothetical protein LBU27_09090 [Candidatus Peribacteria bacterium]|jgi:hypothetical protein|nr:hypothetical protein [Candidatus Peribacteria bacterium]
MERKTKVNWLKILSLVSGGSIILLALTIVFCYHKMTTDLFVVLWWSIAGMVLLVTGIRFLLKLIVLLRKREDDGHWNFVGYGFITISLHFIGMFTITILELFGSAYAYKVLVFVAMVDILQALQIIECYKLLKKIKKVE